LCGREFAAIALSQPLFGALKSAQWVYNLDPMPLIQDLFIGAADAF
jgi:hypothetical protein